MLKAARLALTAQVFLKIISGGAALKKALTQ